MNLTWADWTILIVAMVALRLVSLSTRSLMRGVADFLAANRSAGRYLLTIAHQMGGVGVVTFVATFEVVSVAGFCPTWWTIITVSITSVVIPLTGWIFYRFRETRAMTMAQYLEMRYSRRFRVLAGILCWVSGLINFGIFPAVAARFFMHFCGLPEYFQIPGIPFELPTFATVMIVELTLALSFVMIGGQISVMVTDCVQGIFSAAIFAVVSASILVKIKWPQIVTALSMAPENHSMLNPFHTTQLADFNLWFFAITGTFTAFYSYMSWQGTSGFYGAAKSPHEQRMGNIISVWRLLPQNLLMMLLPIAAITIMRLPEYSALAEQINNNLGLIQDEAVRRQMQVPVAMALFLPAGIKGLLITVMIFITFTCHDTYLHAWGSIFIQDVYLPLRKKALSPAQHIRLLRLSIAGVALFAFLFSLLYSQSQHIIMFFAITGAIWTAGSGIVIIGGLYWRRGTAAGAYSAMIVGAVFGVGGLIIPEFYMAAYGRPFPINGGWLAFFSSLLAIAVYVSVSLMTSKKPFNLERMLHRGEYAIATDRPQNRSSFRGRFLQLIGITEEFSRSDRVLAVVLVAWNTLWLTFFVVFSLINVVLGVSDAIWAKYWHFVVIMNLCLSIPISIWFAVGGTLDIRALYRILATAVRDATDDGRVVGEPDAEATDCALAPDTVNESAVLESTTR